MNGRLTFLGFLATIAYIHPAWAIPNCDNLLALRLAVVGQPYGDVLSDCDTTTFTRSSSPSVAAFDCVGDTANECAAKFQKYTPEQYMKGGWSANNELWYLPLDDDVEGGNLCLDGTRQLIHVDKAVTWRCSRRGTRCTTDADCPGKKNLCQMSDIESDNWVFYTQGGTDCLNADDCLQKYFTESLNTTLNAPFGRDGHGVLSADPRNPFHRFNRVRLYKCTMDGFRGNITRPAGANEPRPSGDLGGDTHEFDLHFHGYRHWLAAFNKLKNARTDHAEYYGNCDNDTDCDADDECVLDVAGRGSVHMCRSVKQLPALADANNVLLIGWSGGSRGLAHTGDSLVDYLQGGATPVAPFAKVKLAFDAPWKPGLENEVAFELGLRSMYSIEALGLQVPTSASPGELPRPDPDVTIEARLYSNASFVPGGESYESNTYWGAQLDESCLLSHSYKTWHCHERAHVLSHHVTAPTFTRMAQRDASGKDKPDANHMHSKALCTLAPIKQNCYDWEDEDFRQRTFQQITIFHREFALLAEEGLDAPRRGTFSTNTTSHNGFEDEEEFFDVKLMRCRENGTRLNSHTLSSALSRWFRTGRRIGAIEFREGVTQRGQGYVWLSKTTCNRCPRVLATQDFVPDDRLTEWDLSDCTY